MLGVLLEPTTVVAKAWEQVRLVGERAHWEPRTVLVTGAGPIGLLAALVGTQRGLEVHVLDRTESGPSPSSCARWAPIYHTGSATGIGFDPDVIIECTGVGQVIVDSLHAVAPGGIVCLTGVGSGAARQASPPRTSPRRWCCRTTWSSAASTRTSGTGTRRGRCSARRPCVARPAHHPA